MLYTKYTYLISFFFKKYIHISISASVLLCLAIVVKHFFQRKSRSIFFSGTCEAIFGLGRNTRSDFWAWAEYTKRLLSRTHEAQKINTTCYNDNTLRVAAQQQYTSFGMVEHDTIKTVRAVDCGDLVGTEELNLLYAWKRMFFGYVELKKILV